MSEKKGKKRKKEKKREKKREIDRKGCFMNFCAFAFSGEFVPNYFLDNLFLFIVCTVLLEYVQLSSGFVQ